MQGRTQGGAVPLLLAPDHYILYTALFRGATVMHMMFTGQFERSRTKLSRIAGAVKTLFHDKKKLEQLKGHL